MIVASVLAMSASLLCLSPGGAWRTVTARASYRADHRSYLRYFRFSKPTIVDCGAYVDCGVGEADAAIEGGMNVKISTPSL